MIRFKPRKTVTIILAGIMMFSFTACGSATSGSSTSSASKTDTQPSSGNNKSMAGGGAVDKSSDTELQTMISDVSSKFKQVNYTDDKTGLSISYNIFLPDGYDSSKSYPLVMFIADSSSVGTDTTAPLTQGYGGLIWATDESQAKNQCIVVVPCYPEVILDDHSGYKTTDYIDLTYNLIQNLSSKYSVDKNRIYGTGQSMGCMTTMLIASEHPNLYAACLFVDGQWDTSVLSPLASQTFCYFAAEGDDSAYSGMQDLIPVLKNKGASISTAQWDATWSDQKIASACKSLLSENNSINCITWKKGSVLPDGVAEGTSEHMYSFDYAYKVDGIRDWLFNQSK